MRPEIRLFVDVMQHLAPKRRSDHQIEKALDYIERSDCRLIGEKILAYLLSRSFGSLMRGFQKREHHQREISFELFLRLLRNCRSGSCLDSIQSFHRILNRSIDIICSIFMYYTRLMGTKIVQDESKKNKSICFFAESQPISDFCQR